MTERTIQDVVMASIQAEEAGAIINWKQTCLQLVQATQVQFSEMQDQIDELKLKVLDDITTQDVMDVLATQETDE